MVTEEYISGETLDEKLHRQGVMPPELVKYYIRQLLEALEQIHAQGIVHRDISPKNVLISTDGVVKLLDFDIARRRKQNQNADTTILGTVGFASPEQYGFLQTDATADIYALGVLMNDRSCLERDSGSFCISISDCGKHTVSDAVWQDSIDFLPGSNCGIHLCVDILRGWI